MAEGLVKLVPSSISAAVGTATVSANGLITMTAARGVTVNGVFSATYRAYLLRVTATLSGQEYIGMQLTAAGVSYTTNNQMLQWIQARTATQVDAFRSTTSTALYTTIGGSTAANNIDMQIFEPFDASEWTLSISTSYSSDDSGARLVDSAGWSPAASYDGINIGGAMATTTMTGTAQVYGYLI